MSSARSPFPAEPRQRLDLVLVERGIAESRARARDAILRGTIRVDGMEARRPAMMVRADASIETADPAARYVSRAALKLIAGLDRFGYSPAGLSVLDVGAGTGGFTEVLLERGAERVHAVDVGHGQLHPRIGEHPAVVSREGLNVRDIVAGDIDGRIDAIVTDLSFISLRLALPPALALAAEGAWGIFLVKPQFEVGRGGLGKGGIVRDPTEGGRAAEQIADWLACEMRWSVDGLADSPITGGAGNREYLLGARKV